MNYFSWQFKYAIAKQGFPNNIKGWGNPPNKGE